MLLYGESGTGKTTFWATFPGKILALICSGGSKPGELRSINTPQYRAKIVPRVVKVPEDIQKHTHDIEQYSTLVLDHASGFADLVLKTIMGVDKLPVQKAWGTVTQQQYGQQALQLKEWFRYLLDLPTHVVIIAQQRVFGGEETGTDDIKPTVGAAMSPSVVGWLNPACDYVVQTFKRSKTVSTSKNVGGEQQTIKKKVGGIEYCMRIEPHETYMTKFRIPGGVKQSVIVNPTYDKVKTILDGSEPDGVD